MKLYQSVGPNPRVATMFIAEKGLSIPREFVDIMKGDNRQPPFLAKNAMGGTPIFESDDGSYLSEGTAICEYLEEMHPSPALIGSTPQERAQTRALMRLVDQLAIVPMTVGFRGSEGNPMFKDRVFCIPNAANDMKALTRDGLAKFDAMLADAPFLAGERFTLADIMLFCFVEFGALVGQPVPDDLKNIATWQTRVGARPSAATSANPENGL